MVRRIRRSIYDELDELRASMDYLFQYAFEPAENLMLPQGENPGIVFLSPRNLNAEISDDDDEVVITVDIIPGLDFSKISVDLVNHNFLRITCDRLEAGRDEGGRCSREDQRSISLHHDIQLPGPVMREGARSTLKNGVFDLHLKKGEPVVRT
ncbi:MAG: Hsp20/alpha crystallin family protein [Methanomicrobiaceae archaeon]|nr:Hsp20/alpha crystallin family protein [Methanomicrobiaceae archaeon]